MFSEILTALLSKHILSINSDSIRSLALTSNLNLTNGTGHRTIIIYCIHFTHGTWKPGEHPHYGINMLYITMQIVNVKIKYFESV
jgi:hypothetical protein